MSSLHSGFLMWQNQNEAQELKYVTCCTAEFGDHRLEDRVVKWSSPSPQILSFTSKEHFCFFLTKSRILLANIFEHPDLGRQHVQSFVEYATVY